MRENGKERESRKIPANFINEQKFFLDYSAARAYILPQLSKITKKKKKPKSKAITRDKIGRKPKREQQSTSQTDSMKE